MMLLTVSDKPCLTVLEQDTKILPASGRINLVHLRGCVKTKVTRCNMPVRGDTHTHTNKRNFRPDGRL